MTNSSRATSSRSFSFEYDKENDDTVTPMNIAVNNSSSVVRRQSDENQVVNPSFNDSIDSLITNEKAQNIDEMDHLVRKINRLTLKLDEALRVIQDQQAQIKRLKMTSLGK